MHLNSSEEADYDSCFKEVFPKLPSYKITSENVRSKNYNYKSPVMEMEKETSFDMGLVRWASGCGYGGEKNDSYPKEMGPILNHEDKGFPDSKSEHPQTISIMFLRYYSQHSFDHVVPCDIQDQRKVGKYSNQCLSGFVSYYGLIYWINFFPKHTLLTWRLATEEDVINYNEKMSESAKDCPFTLEHYKKWLLLSEKQVSELSTMKNGGIDSIFITQVISNLILNGFHHKRDEINLYSSFYLEFTHLYQFKSQKISTLTRINQSQLNFFVASLLAINPDSEWENDGNKNVCKIILKGTRNDHAYQSLDNEYKYKIRYNYNSFKVNDSSFLCWARGLLQELLSIRENNKMESKKKEETEEEEEEEEEISS